MMLRSQKLEAAQKLRLLACWFDVEQRRVGRRWAGYDVQNDLLIIAASLELEVFEMGNEANA